MALPALSHDFWFEPDSFFVSQHSELPIKLKAGDNFKVAQEGPMHKDRTLRYEMFSTGQTQDLFPETPEGKIPATSVKFGPAGNYLLAMERKPQLAKLTPKDFDLYLAEEKLESIIEERKRRGEEKAEGREQFIRYVKALFQVGDTHDDTYKRLVGHRLEIVPQRNPYEMKVGERLRVLVLFDGQPLDDVNVYAYNRNEAVVRPQVSKTAGGGLADFKLDRPGNWLVRLIYMRRCDNCSDADWESFWAAFTFGMK
jgi:uncharacterized GH25 family protein